MAGAEASENVGFLGVTKIGDRVKRGHELKTPNANSSPSIESYHWKEKTHVLSKYFILYCRDFM